METVMPDRATIEDFLSQEHIAFVGVSRDSKSFANVVYRQLRVAGKTLYPVNVSATLPTLEGDVCYPRLTKVPDPVDGVIVMVPARLAADVVREAIERGIPRVWLHHGLGPGSVSIEAVALCKQVGVAVVDGACPLMFLQPKSIHRLHRLFSGRRIAA
jgi:predicted CoA-binding protein